MRALGLRTSVRTAVLVLAVSGVLAVACDPAGATGVGPGWQVTSSALPSHLPLGGTGIIENILYNTGAANSKGQISVTDTLPPGVTATSPLYYIAESKAHILQPVYWNCSGVGTSVLTCTNPAGLPSIPTGEVEQLLIHVSVGAVASATETNSVTVAGGGAPAPASTVNPVALDSTPAGFGLSGMDGWFTNADGTLDTQAGSHPYELTIAFDLNSVKDRETGEWEAKPAGGLVRKVDVNLPPGIIGNPTAVPQCTKQQFDGAGINSECPADTQVGIDTVGIGLDSERLADVNIAVYNMVPPPGIPAQFAFYILGQKTYLDAGVRSGGDYGITEHANNLAPAHVISNSITIWGVPGEASHDALRRGSGSGCTEGDPPQEGHGCGDAAPLKAFLTLPTSCAGPQTFTMDASPWEFPDLVSEASFVSHDSSHTPEGFTGCDRLDFAPSIGTAPDTGAADTPAGLTVDVKADQEGLTSQDNPENAKVLKGEGHTENDGLSSADIQDTTVTLPEGMVINPGQAAGLQACQSYQDAVGTEAPPSCPNASRVGTVAIETPLLPHKLEGSVYVLQSNPPNLQLLLAASGEGVNLKLIGDVSLNPVTGRLTTTFAHTPELPFTDLKLAFSGGGQAALSTPTDCGTYATTSDFTPWSSPFVADVFPSSSFAIDTGTDGARCPSSPLPFTPSMIAGSTTDQAGGYTDFSLLLTRPDDQQRIGGLRFKTPEGLLGMISKVPLCAEAQANAGTCDMASQIGHTVVEAGPGPYPLVVPQPGQPPAPIYLTGPYKGAPYGLSIVVPLVVGPFTLQTQVVRAKIEVDPLTAQITVVTDPLPQIIDGVPADLRTIDAVIDRPGFMFNPTDCGPQSFSGTATSSEGATAPLESHFQMGSCQSLKFDPNFKVSTSGKTSRKDGASLTAKILYPTGALGDNQASSQSNVAMVKVDLPKQLPSRLTTLQKACTSTQFEANPAGCPADSRVGQATAITPVLPVPVTGPAYFVSYGGAKFPELVIVLQGYGVTVYLHGETFISKAGITSSTFRHVPDVPITSFELNLPEGPFSALAANGNLCTKKLVMPTAFTGHNGATIHQNTPITVTGCPKHKSKKDNKTNRRNKKK